MQLRYINRTSVFGLHLIIYKKKAYIFLFHFTYILIAVLLHCNSYPFAM